MKFKTMMFVVFTAVICIAFSQNLFAAENKIMMNVNDSIKEILSANLGKRVSVKTDSGEAMEGTVEKVGDQLLHISRLSGKDFYDAIVRIDKINAVIIRARGN